MRKTIVAKKFAVKKNSISTYLIPGPINPQQRLKLFSLPLFCQLVSQFLKTKIYAIERRRRIILFYCKPGQNNIRIIFEVNVGLLRNCVTNCENDRCVTLINQGSRGYDFLITKLVKLWTCLREKLIFCTRKHNKYFKKN